MDISLEILREQLDQLRKRDEMIFKHRATIKSWCVSIWVVIVATVSTKTLDFEKTSALFSLFAPVLLFWLLESIFGAMTYLHVKQTQELEDRIAQENLSIKSASDVFVISRYLKFSQSEKMSALFFAAFKFESILVFYLVLLFASALTVLTFFG